MFAPTNPELERIRAQAMLSSFTDHQKAAEMFAPKNSQVESVQSDRQSENEKDLEILFLRRQLATLERKLDQATRSRNEKLTLATPSVGDLRA